MQPGARRARVNRDRALRAAVALADEAGLESLTMRSLAHELGVVPMALYKHVANKDDLLDGMVDVIIGEIDPAIVGADWRSAVRERILSARRALLRHPWARAAIESRTTMTPVVLGYMESMIGLFRAGGFSVDLTHHVLHALAGRIWGFTQEVFTDPPTPEGAAVDRRSAGRRARRDGDQVPLQPRVGHGDRARRDLGRRRRLRRPVRVRVRPRHPARRVRTTPPAGLDLCWAPQGSCRGAGVTDAVDGGQGAGR